jgi:hypothetical protein
MDQRWTAWTGGSGAGPSWSSIGYGTQTRKESLHWGKIPERKNEQAGNNGKIRGKGSKKPISWVKRLLSARGLLFTRKKSENIPGERSQGRNRHGTQGAEAI